jgi:hypothetical protein
MVTNWSQYEEWRRSFERMGFTRENCEFLVVDNSAGNRADAFVSVNEFLQSASAPHVILVHHDVRLLQMGFEDLVARIDELTAAHPYWAVAGNAGARADSWPVLNLSHPWREHDVRGGPFPARTMTVDENFIVVRQLANLSASRDLRGFHHYAADLCLIAAVLGWEIYVIDFYLRHESKGTFDHRYEDSRRAVASKYSMAFRSRWVELVTNQPFYIGNSVLARRTAPARRKLLKALRLLPRTSRFDQVAESNR